MVHELSHQVAQTGDHIDTSNNRFLNNKEAKAEEDNGSITVNRKGGCMSFSFKFHFLSQSPVMLIQSFL
jgi:hypothetical protein